MTFSPELLLQQLGGKTFIAMTGAKNFVKDTNKILFSIGSGAKDGINRIVIDYDSAKDLYNITGHRIHGINCTQKASQKGIHAEDLRRSFTSMTGFSTKL